MMPPSIGAPLTRERFGMRDNTKKTRPRHLQPVPGPVAAALLYATSAFLIPLTATAQTPAKGEKPCAMARATTGETGQPTGEISTDQMEAALAQIQVGVLVIDARPY